VIAIATSLLVVALFAMMLMLLGNAGRR